MIRPSNRCMLSRARDMMSEDDVPDVSSSVTKRMGVAATEAKTSGL